MASGWSIYGVHPGSDAGEHYGREASRDAVTGLSRLSGVVAISPDGQRIAYLVGRLGLNHSTEHNPFRRRRLSVPVRLASVPAGRAGRPAGRAGWAAGRAGRQEVKRLIMY